MKIPVVDAVDIAVTLICISSMILFITFDRYGHWKALTQKAAIILLWISISIASFAVVLSGVFEAFGSPSTVRGFLGILLLLALVATEAGVLRWVKNTTPEEALKHEKADEETTENSREIPPPLIPQAQGTLPPAPQPQQVPPVCPYCGGPLEYVMEYNRWFCRRCNRYV